MLCPTCSHEEHEPGKCKKDNCGEQELIRPSFGYAPSILDGNNQYTSGAIYNRKGQPRESFKKRGAEGSKRHPGRID